MPDPEPEIPPMLDRRRGSTPNPDPTILTTQQLHRELATQREILEARLTGMDQATRLLQQAADRLPSDLDVKIAHVNALIEQRFAGIQTQFGERDQRYARATEDNKTAFAAAVRAASDAVVQSEASTALQVGAQKSIFEARLDGMDEAIMLVRTVSDRLPGQMDERVRHLEDLTNVKFQGIQTQFAERDVRTEQANLSAKTAVDAALQAQKESAGKQADSFGEATQKSEDQFTKQIDLQGELLRTEVKGLVTQIGELKDRINRGEGQGQGKESAHTSTVQNNNYLLALVGGAVGLIGLLLAFLKP